MKTLTTAIVICLCTALPLRAEVYDPFIVQLREQGYADITVGRTWLGRIVINAQRDDVAREIVLNARTGEILGDHANDIGAPVRPQYSTLESSDHDSGSDIAAVTAPEATATVADVGDVRVILDPGNTEVSD